MDFTMNRHTPSRKRTRDDARISVIESIDDDHIEGRTDDDVLVLDDHDLSSDFEPDSRDSEDRHDSDGYDDSAGDPDEVMRDLKSLQWSATAIRTSDEDDRAAESERKRIKTGPDDTHVKLVAAAVPATAIASAHAVDRVLTEQWRQAATLLPLTPDSSFEWAIPPHETDDTAPMPTIIAMVYASGMPEQRAKEMLAARVAKLQDEKLRDRLHAHLDMWWCHMQTQFPEGSNDRAGLHQMWFAALHGQATGSVSTEEYRKQGFGAMAHRLKNIARSSSVHAREHTESDESEWETFYDDKHILLQNDPTEEEVRTWMIGCLAYISDSESWFARWRSSGWVQMIFSGPSHFPFSSKSSASRLVTLNSHGDEVERNFADILMDLKDDEAFNACRYTTTQFLPYFKELLPTDPHVRVFNTFNGWMHPFSDETVRSDDADVARVNGHLLDLCGGAAVVCAYLLCWLALIVQDPQQKVPLVLLYSREEGVGKNILQEFLLKYVFGKQYVKPLQTTRSILGNFNTATEGRLLTILNECKQDGKSILDNEQFKSLITEVDCDVNAKHKAERAIANFNHYMMFTNHKYACTIGKGRRFMLVQCSEEHVGDAAYFKALCDQIYRPDVGRKYFQWLAQVDLTHFVASKIPETQLKKDVRRDQMSTALKHICDVAENGRERSPANLKPGWTSAIVSVKDLHEDYRRWCAEEGVETKYQLKQSRYKAQLVDDLKLVFKRHHMSDQNRAWGFLLDRVSLEAAMARAIKVPEFKFQMPADNEQ